MILKVEVKAKCMPNNWLWSATRYKEKKKIINNCMNYL